jgi:glucosylceramidase
MKVQIRSRRDFISSGVLLGAGAGIASILKARSSEAQSSNLQPAHNEHVTFVTTTEAKPWQDGRTFNSTFSWTMLNLNIEKPVPDVPPVQGVGACFNELGWTSLQALSEADRDAVMHELFDPGAGARFTYCRMPVGANDFSVEAYSYDETDGDFELRHFSIDHDRKTLIPFIHAALKHQPSLKLWASPWTPPSWMKRNHFYAERPGGNGIRPDQVGHEGEDMFIQEPQYFNAYARYFGKFIDAYNAEGIKIGVVMPQNEFNSAQNFPSCTWTPEGLTRFVRALGPEMESRGVQIYFGTLERGNPKLLETVMADPQAARYIRGVGTQWAGKNALPALHREFPSLKIFQSEQECGDGKNEWSYTSYCWQLMKHYFRSGASGYMYWNIALMEGSKSTWGWAQNSLVAVDPTQKTFRFTHDYYLLKHLSHFVDVGARRLETTGTCDDTLAFLNPDGTTVVLVRNELPKPALIQVQLQGRTMAIELPPDSLGTLSIKA